MSEITMKTIETLPLVEEPAEDASIVGWNDGQTVRMPVGAVGGSKGIVFTYDGNNTTCNYSFDECWELLSSGASVVFVDTDRGLVSSRMKGELSVGGSPSSIAPLTGGAPEGPYIYLEFDTFNDVFCIDYAADYLNSWYSSVAN